MTPLEIESRQDAVLKQLAELEDRILRVLAENGVCLEAPSEGEESPRIGPLEKAGESGDIRSAA